MRKIPKHLYQCNENLKRSLRQKSFCSSHLLLHWRQRRLSPKFFYSFAASQRNTGHQGNSRSSAPIVETITIKLRLKNDSVINIAKVNCCFLPGQKFRSQRVAHLTHQFFVHKSISNSRIAISIYLLKVSSGRGGQLRSCWYKSPAQIHMFLFGVR